MMRRGAIPLTTQHRETLDALRVTILARDQLRETCYTVAEKARALNRSRFGIGPLTVATEEELAALEQQLKGIMGMI